MERGCRLVAPHEPITIASKRDSAEPSTIQLLLQKKSPDATHSIHSSPQGSAAMRSFNATLVKCDSAVSTSQSE